MWDRFSYYGMSALLILYMVKYLLLPGHDDVIGLGAVRGVLESIFGPLGNGRPVQSLLKAAPCLKLADSVQKVVAIRRTRF
jgi:hypothetical protein